MQQTTTSLPICFQALNGDLRLLELPKSIDDSLGTVYLSMDDGKKGQKATRDSILDFDNSFEQNTALGNILSTARRLGGYFALKNGDSFPAKNMNVSAGIGQTEQCLYTEFKNLVLTRLELNIRKPHFSLHQPSLIGGLLAAIHAAGTLRMLETVPRLKELSELQCENSANSPLSLITTWQKIFAKVALHRILEANDRKMQTADATSISSGQDLGMPSEKPLTKWMTDLAFDADAPYIVRLSALFGLQYLNNIAARFAVEKMCSDASAQVAYAAAMMKRDFDNEGKMNLAIPRVFAAEVTLKRDESGNNRWLRFLCYCVSHRWKGCVCAYCNATRHWWAIVSNMNTSPPSCFRCGGTGRLYWNSSRSCPECYGVPHVEHGSAERLCLWCGERSHIEW
jgi:hypothetical protein